MKYRNIERVLEKQKDTHREITPSEAAIHNTIADYLNTVIKRPSRWHTVEVSNQAKGKAAMIRQMALKRRGVKTGWPDIEIFHMAGGDDWPLQVIFLEVKVPGAKLTAAQEELHKELKEDRHNVYVVHGYEEVREILKEEGVI